MVKEAKKQLENKGFVYTLRPLERKHIGKEWYNHYRGDIKRGDVHIQFIGNFLNKESELETYVKNSGFKSLQEWLKKAKKSRYLYKVILLFGNKFANDEDVEGLF
jgi:hypothetical protein